MSPAPKCPTAAARPRANAAPAMVLAAAAVLGPPAPGGREATAAEPKLPAAAAGAGGALLAEALQGPLAGVEEILFIVSQPFEGSFNPFDAGARDRPEKLKEYRKGGRLCKLHLRTGNVTVLVDDPAGEMRDACLHYDGTKALFCYGKGTTGLHLYEIRVDGGGLTRLTPDDAEEDISPCYLPNGDIVFASTRSHRFVGCSGGYATTIYRCRADGSQLAPITASLEIERYPSVLADGRLVFMHWEYYNRGTHGHHPLWTCKPDGTAQATLFGNMGPDQHNYKESPRQIPGSHKVVFANCRNGPTGTIAVLDPSLGPDDPKAVTRVPGSPKNARDPFPLTETWFLSAADHTIALIDGSGRGRSEVVFAADGKNPSAAKGKGPWAMSPWPIRPRARERVIPDRVDPRAATGAFMLTDVHHGRNMAGVKPGEVKKLLVLEWLPAPFTVFPQVRPAFFLNRILGTVPVEADGSAHFEAPALRPLSFVSLDGRGLSVKHKQSATELKPGETIGCTGCHEPRTGTSSIASTGLAMRRGPSRIEPFEGIPDRLDYVEDVQPIWDRHCVKCHNPDRRDGGVLMAGDRGGNGMPHSHLSLFAAGQIVDSRGPHVWGNLPPRAMGSGASALMKKLDGSHHEVKVSPREWQTVQLWLDTMVPFTRYYGEQRAPGGAGLTPAAKEVVQRRCLTCHEDHVPNPGYMGASMLADFRRGEAGKNLLFYKEPDLSHESDIQQKAPATEAEYLKQHQDCFARHEAQLRRGAAILINRTRPEKSLLLLAPLAKSAGGYAAASVAEVKSGKVKAMPVIFANADDPDYQVLLKSIQPYKAQPHKGPRDRYVKWGLLPATAAAFDSHEVLERYWRDPWWKPEGQASRRDSR